MIDAGYSSASAKSNCVDLARKVRVSLEEAARARGIDEAFVLNKLHELSESKTPKWNAETKTWDEFEAGNIQLEAVEKLAEILEPKQVTVKAKLEGADGTPFAIAIINYGVNNSSS